MTPDPDYFIGVDVGTGSVRAALISTSGSILSSAVNSIKTWKYSGDHFEQSSNDIWSACVSTIEKVSNGINPQRIKGIGFDATCSLVAIDEQGMPVSISLSAVDDQNVILWMDHRANSEAEFINSTQHPVLKYVGGKVSLEMQMPKLLWLKKNLHPCWSRAKWFFDLPDFLTWKATGATSRSMCSLICKWNYECNPEGETGWNRDFLAMIGLEDLLENNMDKVGSLVLPPGHPCGDGLSFNAAKELNLLPGTPVGTSIIDAHAGGLGMIGCTAKNISSAFESRMSLICGTSTCHMTVNTRPVFVPGVWGPYNSAMVPNYWLNEAGQSASGALIDHIILSHPAYPSIKEKIGEGLVQEYLRNLLDDMALRLGLENVSFLTNDFHVWPDFHGNRSPIADPSLRGIISGLKLSTNEEDLAVLYLATVQGLSYGTKHIIECLQENGYKKIESLLICGGLSKDPLFVQTQADAVNLPVLKPHVPESVLVGAAILGACGGSYFSDLKSAITHMAGSASIILPNRKVLVYHMKKYQVFLKMLSDQCIYRNIMSS